MGCQWINSLVPGTKVLIDTAYQYLPRKLGRELPTAHPLMQATLAQSTCLGKARDQGPHQI